MGFLRDQEIGLARRLLEWRYKKAGIPAPDDGQLARQAAALVDEAHRVARQRGRNALLILKEMLDDIKKR